MDRCFDDEEAVMDAVEEDHESLRGCVIVIRYEGPKGGPGMKEMLKPTSVSPPAHIARLTLLVPPRL